MSIGSSFLIFVILSVFWGKLDCYVVPDSSQADRLPMKYIRSFLESELQSPKKEGEINCIRVVATSDNVYLKHLKIDSLEYELTLINIDSIPANEPNPDEIDERFFSRIKVSGTSSKESLKAQALTAFPKNSPEGYFTTFCTRNGYSHSTELLYLAVGEKFFLIYGPEGFLKENIALLESRQFPINATFELLNSYMVRYNDQLKVYFPEPGVRRK